MEKKSVMVGLGDFYRQSPTGFATLPFIYNNIRSLVLDLKDKGWSSSTPLLDSMASVKNIIDKMVETINKCAQDEWLLFYFTGHASKYYISPESKPITYCVTYYQNLTKGQYPGLEQFFYGQHYSRIVEMFAKKVPKGHLITVLDCCYAFGLIDDFAASAEFHTVIAATAHNAPALFDDNSVFYKEFTKVLGQPFNTLQKLINTSFANQEIPESCVIKPAKKFESFTL